MYSTVTVEPFSPHLLPSTPSSSTHIHNISIFNDSILASTDLELQNVASLTMKFLLNRAFLASLALGVASGKEINDVHMEDMAYWRELVDAVDSFPSTTAPTKSPTPPPSDAPVTACATIGMLGITF